MSDPNAPSARMCILIVESDPHVRAMAADVLEHLIVESDPHVRAMAADVLEQEGFAIIEALSADYAATLLQSRTDVRVLLTEAATPGDLNGFDLTRIAQEYDPQIAAIIVTGALPPGFSGLAPEARFVRKPYRMTDVIRLIRELTGDQSHSG